MATATRVLLVENEADIRKILIHMLSKSGFRVIEAVDVTTGIRQGLDNEFDILLCDIGLPDGTGVDVLRELRKVKKFPAVALTAYTLTTDVDRHLTAGFDEHVSKPYNYHHLEEVLMELSDK